MKAQIESSSANMYLGGISGRSGKVKKSVQKQPRNDEANSVEIKQYLNKLQEMVPCMPKNKRLSKVEVISYVIEYIRELRRSLGLPPCHSDVEDIEMEAMMLGHFSQKFEQQQPQNQPHQPQTQTVGLTVTLLKDAQSVSPQQARQPLGLISNPKNGNV